MSQTRVSCGLSQPGPDGLVNLDAVLTGAQGRPSSMASRSEGGHSPSSCGLWAAWVSCWLGPAMPA